MKYSGIDLHSNNSVVTVTDEADRVVAERRLPNDLPKILAFLSPWQAELAGVVVESTFYGRPGIMHGLSVILRCDAQFRRMPGSASPTVDLA
ncbi:hypothetical protein P0D72_34185 [Paraburkholderia sediminicola]|uniref:hypothetical protein n=1 Tax=Paraburkholderia sediminicola TaxID=458836 RepID=UPI0038B8F6BE